MKYQNLQEYLDIVFAGKETVTEEMIVQAKKEYRKLYLTRYRKRYKEKYIQISFRIPVHRYKEIQAVAQARKIRATSVIKQWVMEEQKNNETVTNSNHRLYLLQLIDLTEEALNEFDRTLLAEILELLRQMQKEM